MRVRLGVIIKPLVLILVVAPSADRVLLIPSLEQLIPLPLLGLPLLLAGKVHLVYFVAVVRV